VAHQRAADMAHGAGDEQAHPRLRPASPSIIPATFRPARPAPRAEACRRLARAAPGGAFLDGD
jgi:hypothetical protein